MLIDNNINALNWLEIFRVIKLGFSNHKNNCLFKPNEIYYNYVIF